MKTIKQIAEEIGVSKQAIQKRISRDPLKTSIQPYISTNGKTMYIAVAGENLIKSAYSKKATDNVPDNVSAPSIDKPTTPQNDVYRVIVETIELLKEQLKTKDNQIDILQNTNKELTQALENTTAALNASQMLHAGTMKKTLELPEAEKPKKLPFFWLFKKK